MILPGVTYIGPARAGRGSYVKRFMVVHCTANPTSTARGEAAYARSRTDGVGTHFASDATEVIQCLDTNPSVGHVGAGVPNRAGIAWEFCATLATSTERYRQLIAVAAPVMRQAMAVHGIPHRWLTREQALDGASRGLMTHDDSRRWFGSTDHTDPGPNFPRDHLIDVLNGATRMAEFTEQQVNDIVWTLLKSPTGPVHAALGNLGKEIQALRADVAELKARPAEGLDQAALTAGITAALTSPEARAAIVAAVNEAEDS